MLALRRRHPNQDDDIWHRNAPMIRQLYQDEKNTLKEVKSIMEKEKGFPVMPLSIWKMRVRQLGMQKHLKAAQWCLIYQHVRPHLQHEGKKKLKQPTEILINGTQKPWEDVWKEFRRNNALSQRPQQGLLPPLPAGVEIRIPPSQPSERALQIALDQSSIKTIFQLLRSSVVVLQSLLALGPQSRAETSVTLRYADSVYRLCLEGTPFTRLLEEGLTTIQVAFESSHTPGRLGEFQDGQHPSSFYPVTNIAPVGPLLSWNSQLQGILDLLMPLVAPEPRTGQELSLEFDSHHYLFIMIHQLSNGHFELYRSRDNEVSLREILSMTFRLVSRQVLRTLFQSRLQSIKAAWEKLLLAAGRHRHPIAFRFLLQVGMQNDWLEEAVRGHEHLYHAVQNSCTDLVRTLLERGCRPDSDGGSQQLNTAILAAVENEDLDCARLLVQHCDVNREITYPVCEFSTTNFVTFILHFDDDNMYHHHCLNYFLERGANVDDELGPDALREFGSEYCDLSSGMLLMLDYPFSILDYVFYFHRLVFPRIAEFSKAPNLFSRARALCCLQEGVHVLREYLQEDLIFNHNENSFFGFAADMATTPREKKKQAFLKLLFAEQFLLGLYRLDRTVCIMTVKGLLELAGNLASMPSRLTAEILCATARLVASGEALNQGHGLELLQTLLDRGIQVQADALLVAVETHGNRVLDCLIGFCPNLKKHGAEALAAAVSSNNFEATRLLLDGGVDPNSTGFDRRGRKTSVFAIAAAESAPAMMDYLAQRGGAMSTVDSQAKHPFDVLLEILKDPPAEGDLLRMVQHVIEQHNTSIEPCFLPAHILETFILRHRKVEETQTVVEYLLEKGAKLGPGSPLALWIACGGGQEIALQMLNGGAVPNAYSTGEYGHSRVTPLQAAARTGNYALVCVLLERGADPNQQALGLDGMTALQGICAWDPVRSEERIRKEKIITLLLNKGADVNNMNLTRHTALIYAAQVGDLSTAFILLKHGAQVNRVSTILCIGRRTALDAAAQAGRLDMVGFLLHAGAESASAFHDGKHYDGALRLAQDRGHFAVAELIRKHSGNRAGGWTTAHEQTAEKTAPDSHETQPPAPGASRSQTTHRHEVHLIRCNRSGVTTQRVVCMRPNEEPLVVYDPPLEMADSGASSEVVNAGEDMTRADTAGQSWARPEVEIDNESLVTDNQREQAPGEDANRAADQTSGRWEASAGIGRVLHQPEGQVWDNSEERNDGQLVTGSLHNDVFMGFSEI